MDVLFHIKSNRWVYFGRINCIIDPSSPARSQKKGKEEKRRKIKLRKDFKFLLTPATCFELSLFLMGGNSRHELFSRFRDWCNTTDWKKTWELLRQHTFGNLQLEYWFHSSFHCDLPSYHSCMTWQRGNSQSSLLSIFWLFGCAIPIIYTVEITFFSWITPRQRTDFVRGTLQLEE